MDGDASVKISVVVPVYKEESSILPFIARMRPVLETIGSYEILFCLDPSPDRTEEIIAEAAETDLRIGLLVFSRRFGQPAATMAGILNCRGETCVVIDVDLQDPPELIAPMFRKLADGYEVVTARRSSRKGETWLKKLVSETGYHLINRISDVEIPRNTGDFRIITRRVIEELREINESHGFLRGLVALVGFRQAFVEYERDARLAGTGNYNRYLGSLKIGFNGVFGFSTYPLSLMLWTGFGIAVLSAVLIAVTVVTKLIIGQDYPMGVPTIIILVLFMGGVQLMAIGILGEYIGRIYDEVRRRPQFVIGRTLNVEILDSHRPRSGNKLRAVVPR
ncbi:MAG: glycosyltransferase family 2 protein [Alphaproteobacteria bacterium]|nr:glycosyltransferase family 2 protein [Alphaproteobacteria bacterium]